MLSRLPRLPRICLGKTLFFIVFVALWLAQPVHAQSQIKFSFGDAVPSFHGGYYVDGIPSTAFIDTGENRFQKAGRVWGEAIGGVEGVADDLTDIAFFPLREPILFGAAVLGVGALVAADYPLTAYYQDNIHPLFDGFKPPPIVPRGPNSPFRFIGVEDQYLLAGMGLTYAVGFVTNDERAQVAALLSAKAVAYSYLVSHLLLKPVFGRIRPVPNLSDYGGPVDVVTAGNFSPNPYNWGNSIAPSLRSTRFVNSPPPARASRFSRSSSPPPMGRPERPMGGVSG